MCCVRPVATAGSRHCRDMTVQASSPNRGPRCADKDGLLARATACAVHPTFSVPEKYRLEPGNRRLPCMGHGAQTSCKKRTGQRSKLGNCSSRLASLVNIIQQYLPCSKENPCLQICSPSPRAVRVSHGKKDDDQALLGAVYALRKSSASAHRPRHHIALSRIGVLQRP